jgi:hypothetical protein
VTSPREAETAVDAWFSAQPDLDVERVGDRGWLTVLSGERKRTIPVYLALGRHTLTIQSFFMRAPDERLGEVYGLLLRRNLRTYTLRFALTDDGDVLVVGVLPLHAVTEDELDRVLGQLLVVSDEAFNPALRAGFASYIEAEQAWREGLGLAPNPITDAPA